MPGTEFMFFYGVCLFFCFVLGTAIGSGVMCSISRRGTGESWAKGRSHCDSCGHILSARDLIPIISFLWSKGKCRYCGKNIPGSCVVSELMFGMLGLVIATLVLSTGLPVGFRAAMCAIALAAVLGYIIIYTRAQDNQRRGGDKP